MNPPLLIYNPVSGCRGINKRLEKIFSVSRNVFPGLATCSLEEFSINKHLPGIDHLVIAGGDGTIHCTLNAILNEFPRESLPDISFIPAGSGNDLMRSVYPVAHYALGLHLEALAKAKPFKSDIGLASWSLDGKKQSRYFFNVLSAGVSGNVVARVHQRQQQGKKFNYSIEGIKAFKTYTPATLKRSFDNDPVLEPVPKTLTLFAIANGQYFGNGLHLAPKARLDSQQLESIWAWELSLAEYLWHYPKILRGQIHRIRKVEARSLKTLHVEFDNPVFLEMDGESHGQMEKLDVQVLPGAISLR